MHKVSLSYFLYINFFFALDTEDHNIDPSNQDKKFNRLTDIAEEQGNIVNPYNPHAKGAISDLYYPDSKGKVSDNYHTKGNISNAHNPKGASLSTFLYKI